MAIAKWSPWHEIEAMERRMRRLFDVSLSGPMMLPSTDVYETDAEWVAELEVPGFPEKDLTVEVLGDTVRVAGKREEAEEQKKKAFHLRERLETAFERRFTLPAGTDADSVRATHDNGVLRVRVPKSATAAGEPKSIPIGTKP